MASKQIEAQKQAIVNELAESIKASVAGVLVDYKCINVEDDTKLRAELRKAGVKYSVIKNTLIKRAFTDVGYQELEGCLKGMTALAISENDQIAAAKILAEYAKNHDNFVLKGGYVDGNLLDHDGIMALAETPSKEVLIGRMLGSLQSSLYGFAFGLQAIIDKKEAEGEVAAE